jgi:hypothetical protein
MPARFPNILLVKTILIIFAIVFNNSCNKITDLILPDLPEKLCVQCVIDVDNDLNRSILLGKSFQSDYYDTIQWELYDLTISISGNTSEIYKFNGPPVILIDTIIRPYAHQIPDSVAFPVEEKYSIHAKERDTPEISSEVGLPVKPSSPTVLSVKKLTLTDPLNIVHPVTRYAVVSMSFKNNPSDHLFYTFLVEGTGIRYDLRYYKWLSQRNLIQYEILESNVSAFSSPIIPFPFTVYLGGIAFGTGQLNSVLIDGSAIPGNECCITFRIEVGGLQIYNFKNPVRIRLLSIPKELYLFEKSLYTYNQRHNDPFSEPAHLDGNIKRGEGIFAVCRSSETSLSLPWQEILSDEL